MTVLVIAEHDNAALAAATLNTVTAAGELGEVHVLVAGSGCSAVGEACAQVAGVAKVLLADAPSYAHALAEPVAALVVALAEGYEHIVVPATKAVPPLEKLGETEIPLLEVDSTR